jgi:hypothetical protein
MNRMRYVWAFDRQNRFKGVRISPSKACEGQNRARQISGNLQLASF